MLSVLVHSDACAVSLEHVRRRLDSLGINAGFSGRSRHLTSHSLLGYPTHDVWWQRQRLTRPRGSDDLINVTGVLVRQAETRGAGLRWVSEVMQLMQF